MKTLFVSMSELPDHRLGSGRKEIGDLVSYSYRPPDMVLASDDVKRADKVCIYVGSRKMDEALDLARRAKEFGKQVHIFACHCRGTYKEEFAAEHHIDITFTDYCGGYPQLTQEIRAIIGPEPR